MDASYLEVREGAHPDRKARARWPGPVQGVKLKAWDPVNGCTWGNTQTATLQTPSSSTGQFLDSRMICEWLHSRIDMDMDFSPPFVLDYKVTAVTRELQATVHGNTVRAGIQCSHWSCNRIFSKLQEWNAGHFSVCLETQCNIIT